MHGSASLTKDSRLPHLCTQRRSVLRTAQWFYAGCGCHISYLQVTAQTLRRQKFSLPGPYLLQPQGNRRAQEGVRAARHPKSALLPEASLMLVTDGDLGVYPERTALQSAFLLRSRKSRRQEREARLTLPSSFGWCRAPLPCAVSLLPAELLPSLPLLKPALVHSFSLPQKVACCPSHSGLTCS